MSCSLDYNYANCSSREYRTTCATCYHFSRDKSNTIYKLLDYYKSVLNFKNPDHRGNFKFVNSYIVRLKKKDKENWIIEAAWFLCEVIDLHLKTLGRVN